MEDAANGSFAGKNPRQLTNLAQGNFRSRRTNRLICFILLYMFDIVSIASGFVIASILKTGFISPMTQYLIVVTCITYSIFAVKEKAISRPSLLVLEKSIANGLTALAATLAAVLLLAFLFRYIDDMSRLTFFVGSALAALLLVSFRVAMIFRIRKSGENLLLETLHITDSEGLVGIISPNSYDVRDLNLRPDNNDPAMLDWIARLLAGVDDLYITCAPERRQAWSNIMKGSNVHCYIMTPELDRMGIVSVTKYEGKCAIGIAHGPLDLRSRMIKRIFDLGITVPLSILLLPFFGLIAALIKLEDGGPVFFIQQRMGRGNRLFNILKFRSMKVGQLDSNGSISASRDDDRITRIGRIIRATSMDELPQLFNVIFGDMSLVGPRPHALGSSAQDRMFWEIDARYWHRHATKPGITGLAQVQGFRGATLLESDLTDRLSADLQYVNGWSIWRDFRILCATLLVVVHKNAF